MTTSVTRAALAASLALAFVLLPGCGTVSIPLVGGGAPNYAELPEQELHGLAATIEGEVRAGNREPAIENTAGLVVDTPEVVQAIHTRAARAALVDQLLSTGFAAEQPNGTITLLRSGEYKKATSARERDKNALVVMSENQNRWTIYEGIIKASNLRAKSLPAVQDAFYKARVELLQAGQKYEDPSGAVVEK